MDSTRAPIDPIDQEEIESARTMSPAVKFWLGLDLFDRSCMFMLMGIRLQFPDVDDRQAMKILCDRLDMLERMEGRA